MTAKDILYKHIKKAEIIFAGLPRLEAAILAAMEEYRSHKYGIPAHGDPIELIKKLMKRDKISQMDIVRAIGINKTNLSMALGYKRHSLTKKHMLMISTILNIPEEYFLAPYKLKPKL